MISSVPRSPHHLIRAATSLGVALAVGTGAYAHAQSSVESDRSARKVVCREVTRCDSYDADGRVVCRTYTECN